MCAEIAIKNIIITRTLVIMFITFLYKNNKITTLAINVHQGRKEGNVLFNDTLNTFYLRLYGFKHMVKDHSDSERGNPLLPHGLLFRLAARVLLYASFQTG